MQFAKDIILEGCLMQFAKDIILEGCLNAVC